jgi:hypothetical protein
MLPWWASGLAGGAKLQLYDATRYKAQHNYTLAFEADIISSGQTIWDLHI